MNSKKMAPQIIMWMVGFLSLAIYLTAGVNGAGLKIDAKDMLREGIFDEVLLPTYSKQSALFTRAPGASLTVVLNPGVYVKSARIRSYNYESGRNLYSLTLNDEPPVFVESPLAEMGLIDIRHQFSDQILLSKFKVTAESIQQNAALIDHVEFELVEDSAVYVRLYIGLAILLGLVLLCTNQLVVVHQTSGGNKFHYIDEMRGIAVLLVLLLHARGYSHLPDFVQLPLLGSFLKHGNLGVEIFYFISAFTLTLSLLDGMKKNPIEFDVVGFWLRRIVRILPAFLAVVTVMILFRQVAYPGAQSLSISQVLFDYSFMRFVFDNAMLNYLIQHSAWWSISTEFQFYIILPVVAGTGWLSIRRLGRAPRHVRLIGCACLAAVGVILSFYTRSNFSTETWAPYLAMYHFDVFCSGIALAILLHGRVAEAVKQQAPRLATYILARAWIVMLLLSVAIYPNIDFVGQKVLGDYWATYGLASKRAIFIAFMSVSILAANWGERLLPSDRFSQLGNVGVLSFVIYLVHIPALQIVQKYFPVDSLIASEQVYVAIAGSGFVLSIIFGLLLHRLVEIPGINLGRKFRQSPSLLVASHLYVGAVIYFVYFLK